MGCGRERSCLAFYCRKRNPSVKFDVLVGVPDGFEKSRKLLLRDDHRGAVVVGVEREGGPLASRASRKRWTWFAGSLISPKGETDPGRSPSQRSMRCSEANDSFCPDAIGVRGREWPSPARSRSIRGSGGRPCGCGRRGSLQCFEPSSCQYWRAISMVGASGCSYHV